MELKFFSDLSKPMLEHIAKLHFNKWSPLNKSLSLDNKIKEFTEEYAKSSDKLPLGIALFENDELVGFCRLKKLNLDKYPELCPWISSLLILNKFQGIGHGKALVEKSCEVLKALGYDKVYIYTDQAPDFYRKLGFTFLQNVEKNDGGTAELFIKTLLSI